MGVPPLRADQDEPVQLPLRRRAEVPQPVLVVLEDVPDPADGASLELSTAGWCTFLRTFATCFCFCGFCVAFLQLVNAKLAWHVVPLSVHIPRRTCVAAKTLDLIGKARASQREQLGGVVVYPAAIHHNWCVDPSAVPDPRVRQVGKWGVSPTGGVRVFTTSGVETAAKVACFNEKGTHEYSTSPPTGFGDTFMGPPPE
jgi:hypothetical protein